MKDVRFTAALWYAMKSVLFSAGDTSNRVFSISKVVPEVKNPIDTLKAATIQGRGDIATRTGVRAMPAVAAARAAVFPFLAAYRLHTGNDRYCAILLTIEKTATHRLPHSRTLT
jgi:hypothetical protein